MAQPVHIGRLHVLTDFHFQQRLPHAALAEAAVQGGADTIQFRQKTGPIRNRLADLRAVAEVCRRPGITLLVDDHVDLALAVCADGVHLGQHDLPIGVARRLLGPAAVIGATASTPDEARKAEAEGASYIGFGPVFPTGSKANPQPVRGLSGLAAACRAVTVPVIAIAGITPERVGPTLEAGAHGVAVMTAITTAAYVAAATHAFREAIDDAL
jgi:thiamine-phosphate pyrophosphorylase